MITYIGLEPFSSRRFKAQCTQLFNKYIKINSVKGLGEIQEEHSTSTTVVNLSIYMIENIGKTGVSGVTLPESRLGQ